MLLHKGLRKQWKHYITGTVNKFKSNPQTISWKGSEVSRPWVSALRARGDELSAHVRMAAGDSAQRIPSGRFWIAAWPSSCLPKISHMLGHSCGHGMVYDSPNVGNVAQKFAAILSYLIGSPRW